MFNPFMTLAKAKEIEESITEAEAPCWLVMLQQCVLPPAERTPGMALRFPEVPNSRSNEMLSAAIAIVNAD